MISMILLTLKESTKEKAFYGSLIVFLFSLGLYFIVNGFTMFEPEKVMLIYSLSTVELLSLMLVFFLMFTFLNEDLGKRSLEYLLSLPIKRWNYIIGRFLGISLAVLIVSFVSTTVFFFLNYLVFGKWYVKMFLQVPLLVMMAMMILAFAFLLMNASKRPVLIAFLVLFIYAIGINLDDAVQFLSTNKAESIPLISKVLVKIAYYIFPNLSFFDMKIPIAYRIPIKTGHYFLVLLYGIVYTGFILLFVTLLFERKEIK